MIWYLLNIAILILAYLLPSKDKVIEEGYDLSRGHRKRICVIGSFTWILLSGLRHLSVGPDTRSYKFMFEDIRRTSWKTIFDSFWEGYLGETEILRDPGYRVFTKAFQIFSKDYRVFMFFIAIVVFVAMGIFLFKLSRNPFLSYILFSGLFYSFFAFTGYRQTIATVIIVFCGSFLIKDKKFVKFLLVALLASTIHLSCLCFLPMYFIAKLPINKFTMSVYWLAIGSSFIFRYQLLNLLKFIIGYEQYNDYEGAQAGIFMLLLLAVAVVVTVFQKKLLASNLPTVQFTIHAVMVACFFIPLSMINQSCMRVVYYFALFLMLLLPELGQIFHKNTDKKFYTMFATILIVVMLMLNKPTYQFMWQ